MDPMGYHIFVFSDKPNCWSIFVRGSIASKLAGGLVVLREKKRDPQMCNVSVSKILGVPSGELT